MHTQYKGRIFEQEFDLRRHLVLFGETVFFTYDEAYCALCKQSGLTEVCKDTKTEYICERYKDKVKDYPKIHPAQKPVNVLKRLIEIFTDEGDTVIDPCAGSGTTLRACMELNRNSYGFEISKEFYRRAKEEMLVYNDNQIDLFSCGLEK